MSFLPDKEEWRPVFGREGLYEVSSLGRVRRLGGTKSCRNDRLLKGQIAQHGYLTYQLSNNGTKKAEYAHKLVAEAFIGPRPSGTEINHKDGVKLHNWPENLEYVTRQESSAHARLFGLYTPPSGEGHYKSKLTKAQVVSIREKYALGATVDALVAEYGLAAAYVRTLVLGKTWAKAGGPVTRRGKAKGEALPFAKLTQDSVRIIRESSASNQELAAQLGVHPRTVADVRSGRTWKAVA